MPKFITITFQCDWDGCSTLGDEGSGEVIERTLTLDNKQTKLFLVCAKHSEALDDVVLPLLARGVTVDEPKKTRKTKASRSTGEPAETVGNGRQEQICAICGKTFKGNAGLGQHVIRTHDYSSLDHYRSTHAHTT